MLIYLDLCCLKRPFDDQAQPRVRLESEAVLAMMAAESATLQFVRSAALILENSRNPVATRAARVEQWLRARPGAPLDMPILTRRLDELIALGFRNFDALHIASAEAASATFLVTCDDQFLATAARNRDKISTRVISPVELATEVLP